MTKRRGVIPDTSVKKLGEVLNDRDLHQAIDRNIQKAQGVSRDVLSTLGVGMLNTGSGILKYSEYQKFVNLILSTSQLSVNLIKTLGAYAATDDFKKRIDFIRMMVKAVEGEGIRSGWGDYLKGWDQNALNPNSHTRAAQHVAPLRDDPLYTGYVVPHLKALTQELDIALKDIRVTGVNQDKVFARLSAITDAFEAKARKAREADESSQTAQVDETAATIVYRNMMADSRGIVHQTAGRIVRSRTDAQRKAAAARKDAAKKLAVAKDTLFAHDAASSVFTAATAADEVAYLRYSMLSEAALFLISSHALNHAQVLLIAEEKLGTQISNAIAKILSTQDEQMANLRSLKTTYLGLPESRGASQMPQAAAG